MLVLYQEWAEAVAFSTVVFDVNNGVLPKRRVCSDRHRNVLISERKPAGAVFCSLQQHLQYQTRWLSLFP